MSKIINERIAALEFYQNGPVVWKNRDGTSVMCPVPTDTNNPNTYVIASYNGQQTIPCLWVCDYEDFGNYQPCDCDGGNCGWNSGELCSAVESLVRDGWRCYPMTVNTIVADDTQVVRM